MCNIFILKGKCTMCEKKTLRDLTQCFLILDFYIQQVQILTYVRYCVQILGKTD
jgi:hypothetical protein